MASSIDQISALVASNNSIYTALPGSNSIRLLNIEPGGTTDVINCSLKIVRDYEYSPSYCALSYCWGDVTDVVRAKVHCDGIAITITNSLYHALQHVRLPDQCVLLWADAICIDQSNNDERNHQVAFMKQIYGQATRVYVWLGPSDESITTAIEAMHEIADACCRGYYGEGTVWSDTLYGESHPKELVHSPQLSGQALEYWPRLTPIFCQPWFRRIWVIQEAQSCADTQILCRGRNLSWKLVALVARWIAHDGRDGSLPTTKIAHEDFRRVWRSFRTWHATFLAHNVMHTCSETPFLSVLRWSRTFLSSDPRDKIFAMLQHPVVGRGEFAACATKTATHLDLRADYGKPTTEVYHEVALQSILQSESLDVLSHYWYRQSLFAAPFAQKWVPRWDQSAETLLPLPTWQYNASRSLKCLSVDRDAFNRSLVLSGIRLGDVLSGNMTITNMCRVIAQHHDPGNRYALVSVDTLEAVARLMAHDRWEEHRSAYSAETESLRVKDNLEAHFADFAAWLLPHLVDSTGIDFYLCFGNQVCDICNCEIARENERTPEPPPLHYGCSLCENDDFDICKDCYARGERCHNPIHASHYVLYRTAGMWYHHTDGDLQRLEEVACGGDAERFKRLLRYTVRGRTWLASSRGYVGCGQQSTLPGDVLVILFGAKVPFVLRPQSDGRYELIGDCYVDGMMDGEAIEMLDRGELEVERFELC